ncbi:MAG: 6-phosphofructokinase [Clostridia bacterium]|nr:6-phosphofructokinase [Clostridia bacterium]
MKKIGVLTSGGDSPGMNAAVRAVVRTACYLGMEVVGVRYGYKGLLENDYIELNMRNVCDIIHRGGTKIYSARCVGFREMENVRKGVQNAKEHGIEGLVVIGGDGSFRGARDLSNEGLPTIAMPGTIDNDIVCTDYTIGFDTCLNTIQELVDRLRDTIESHSRCSVVEVMGARAGYLTLNAGIAVGATAILIPEIPYDIEKDVIGKILRTRATGKHHFIIMMAEGIRFRDGLTVDQLAKRIQDETGIETRATVLGHMQRGGSPSVRDRVKASQMGNKAVHLLYEGSSNRVVVSKGEEIIDYDINEALEMKKTIDMDLYNCAMEISL